MKTRNLIILISILLILLGLLILNETKPVNKKNDTNLDVQDSLIKVSENILNFIDRAAYNDTSTEVNSYEEVQPVTTKEGETLEYKNINLSKTEFENSTRPLKSIIKGRIQNAPKKYYPLTFQNMKTLEYDTLGMIELSYNGSFNLEVEVSAPFQVYINFSEKNFYVEDLEVGIVKFLIQPNDTISFFCNLNKPKKLFSGRMQKQTIRFDSSNYENQIYRDLDKKWGGYAYSNESNYLDYSPLEYSEMIIRMEKNDIEKIETQKGLNNIEKQYLKCQVKSLAYMSYRNFTVRKNATDISSYFSEYIQNINYSISFTQLNSLFDFIFYDALWRSFEKINPNGNLLDYFKYVETKILHEDLQRIIQATAYRDKFHRITKEQRKEVENYSNKIRALNTVDIGEQAPDWKLPNVKGKSIRLSELKGNVVLIEFWFPFCKGCVDAIPEINEIQNKYNSEGLKIFGIEYTQSDDKDLIEYIAKYNINYSTLHSGGEVAKKYGVGAAPTFFLIDKSGKVVFRCTGFYKKEIIKKIEEIL